MEITVNKIMYFFQENMSAAKLEFAFEIVMSEGSLSSMGHQLGSGIDLAFRILLTKYHLQCHS